jgi:hypothetical protein
MKVVIDGVLYAPMPNIPSDGSLLSALELRIDSDAGDNITIRDYLHELLALVWAEGDGFNGKRPFGNSGWEYELYIPLIAAGYVDGVLDEGYIESFDLKAARAFIQQLIAAAIYGVRDEV